MAPSNEAKCPQQEPLISLVICPVDVYGDGNIGALISALVEGLTGFPLSTLKV